MVIWRSYSDNVCIIVYPTSLSILFRLKQQSLERYNIKILHKFHWIHNFVQYSYTRSFSSIGMLLIMYISTGKYANRKA